MFRHFRLPPFRLLDWCFGWALVTAVAMRGADSWEVLPSGPLVDLPNVLPNDPVLIQALGVASERVSEWKPPVDAGAWRARRPIVERALRKSLGLDPLPPRTPLNPRILGSTDFGDYTVDTLVLEPRPGFLLTGNLYRPTAPSLERRPAILSPIGHFLTPGKTAPEVQARCIQLARMGFVVFVYDAIGQGERMTPGNIHHDAGYALLPLGQTIAGWMVWDSMRALDYLVTREDVDARRLGVTGNSGGGLNTVLTAALDERVAAAVVVGFTFEFGNWLKYGGAHCTCTHFPGIFQQMEWFEIAGLAAPRALMMIQGANDGIFPIRGAARSGGWVESIYRQMGVEERGRFVALAGMPHAYSKPFREAMYGWMKWHLMSRGKGERIEEAELKLLPENDPRLLCDPNRAFMPASPTVVDLARREAKARVAGISVDPSSEERLRIRAWANAFVGDPGEPVQGLYGRTHRREQVGTALLERVTYCSEEGLRLPGLLWHSTNATTRPPRPVILVADGRGKSSTAEAPWLADLIRDGFPVFAVDLRGRGETLGRYGPRYDTNFRLTANQVLMGRPLAACRAWDLRRALDYLSARPEFNVDGTIVVGVGEDGIPAILAGLTDRRIWAVALAGMAHGGLSRMHARWPIPPVANMGDAWNDPQLNGRIALRHGESDFGSVIPSSFEHGDLHQWIQSLSPKRVLFSEATDLEDLESAELFGRFQQIAASPNDSLVYQPKESLGKRLPDWVRSMAK